MANQKLTNNIIAKIGLINDPDALREIAAALRVRQSMSGEIGFLSFHVGMEVQLLPEYRHRKGIGAVVGKVIKVNPVNVKVAWSDRTYLMHVNKTLLMPAEK
jgi:hypothetical protein